MHCLGVIEEAATDILEHTGTVSDYITFCEGLCIPTKTTKSYTNENTLIQYMYEAQTTGEIRCVQRQ